MRKLLPFLIVGLVAIATLTVAAFFYRAKLPAPQTVTSSPEKQAQDPSIHALGPADALVTVEEFGDFQCPPCGLLSEPLNKIEKELRPNVRLLYRNFPLPLHQHAMAAAQAAEAAGRQDRFWEMHDLLYREQAIWSKTTEVKTLLHSYAGILGLDLGRFHKDMAAAETSARIMSDHSEGKKRGVTNTPTLFINGTELPPTSLRPSELRAAVEAAIKAKQSK